MDNVVDTRINVYVHTDEEADASCAGATGNGTKAAAPGIPDGNCARFLIEARRSRLAEDQVQAHVGMICGYGAEETRTPDVRIAEPGSSHDEKPKSCQRTGTHWHFARLGDVSQVISSNSIPASVSRYGQTENGN